jgi:Replicative DNA helicase
MSSLKNIEILSNLNESPQNLEAEQTVLGSILLSNEIYDEITDINEESFYNPVNKKFTRLFMI